MTQRASASSAARPWTTRLRSSANVPEAHVLVAQSPALDAPGAPELARDRPLLERRQRLAEARRRGVVAGADAHVVAAHVLGREVLVERRAQKRAPQELEPAAAAVNQLVADDDRRPPRVVPDEHRADPEVGARDALAVHEPQVAGEQREVNQRRARREGRRTASRAPPRRARRRPAGAGPASRSTPTNEERDRQHRQRHPPRVRRGRDEHDRHGRQEQREEVTQGGGSHGRCPFHIRRRMWTPLLAYGSVCQATLSYSASVPGSASRRHRRSRPRPPHVAAGRRSETKQQTRAALVAAAARVFHDARARREPRRDLRGRRLHPRRFLRSLQGPRGPDRRGGGRDESAARRDAHRAGRGGARSRTHDPRVRRGRPHRRHSPAWGPCSSTSFSRRSSARRAYGRSSSGRSIAAKAKLALAVREGQAAGSVRDDVKPEAVAEALLALVGGSRDDARLRDARRASRAWRARSCACSGRRAAWRKLDR